MPHSCSRQPHGRRAASWKRQGVTCRAATARLLHWCCQLGSRITCRYGFVRYGSVGEAQAAISTLDGTSVLGHTLQVKFADADAGERDRGRGQRPPWAPSLLCGAGRLPHACSHSGQQHGAAKTHSFDCNCWGPHQHPSSPSPAMRASLRPCPTEPLLAAAVQARPPCPHHQASHPLTAAM